MKQSIWNAKYEINSLVLNHRKRLGLWGMLQILQDIAWVHATHLGHGYDDMLENGTLWVLTRFKLVMTGAWPAWGDEIDVNTWPRMPKGATVNRDYTVNSAGQEIAQATATWLVLSQETRRPLKLSLKDEALAAGRTEGTLTLEPAKLHAREDLTDIGSVLVRNGDLDVNGHVNNTNYARWMLDMVPLAAFDAYELVEYEINFLAESNIGDSVIISSDIRDLAPGAASDITFQGRRESDGKPVFIARMGVRARP